MISTYLEIIEPKDEFRIILKLIKKTGSGQKTQKIKLLKIRDYCNISLENKRSEKEIGSSLEAKVELKLKNNLFEKFSNFDFEELLIISSANVINDDSIKDDIQVSTTKANGKKCPVCWKIRSDECERHGKIN